ncbi:PREDICTED: uncharacterized protein LOC105561358 [Vollenhovia emeryi]|uniref:uncharacterized protein LOC105561358 n=1 Tax=Vollenhovia emeryi TaxID=411798 RepID=UPI0005F3B68B|nr:PREDICTED: uncharacterized protein LOC105561358 [Vollenhovia emeryi]
MCSANYRKLVKKMPNLTLFDEISQKTYILQVSEEEYARANKDMLFATRLLQEKLNANQTGKVNEPGNDNYKCSTSTSSSDDKYNIHDKEKAQESSDFEEKVTDSFRWAHEVILLLLTIYKEHEDKMTSGKVSVKKFWNMISSLLIEKGHHITGTQCKSKMAGLKNTYKNVKDHNAKSGNNTRTWRYFDVSMYNVFYSTRIFMLLIKLLGVLLMDEMFNKKPWMAPVSTLDTANPIPVFSEEHDENNVLSATKTELPIKRKNNINTVMYSMYHCLLQNITIIGKRRTVLEQMFEENITIRKKMHEEAMARQDKLLDILSKVLEK